MYHGEVRRGGRKSPETWEQQSGFQKGGGCATARMSGEGGPWNFDKKVSVRIYDPDSEDSLFKRITS